MSTQSYNPEEYWSRVGSDIRQRASGSVVAGDDAPYYRHQRRTFLRRFLDPIDIRDKIVLEVGCGPGGNLRHLATRGPQKIIGIDISRTMLSLAQETLKDCANVDLLKTDGTSLPLPDRSVDIALTVTVLQHNSDRVMFERLAGEIFRVARDRVILCEAIGDGRANRDGNWIARPLQDFEGIAERAGFKLQQQDYLRTLFSRRIHRRLSKALAPKHQEGERFPLRARLAFNAALPLTRLLDPILSPLMVRTIGLARMEFVRVDLPADFRTVD